MKNLLETERLEVRRFLISDASFIIKLMNSPGWLEFIGDREIKTIQKAKSYIRSHFQKAYFDLGFGFYVLIEKDTQRPVGITGFVKRSELPYVDFGYALLPEHEGKGYLSEIGKALLFFGKTTFEFTMVCAITEEKNLKSQRVLEKLGFKNLGLREVKDELLLYFEREL